MGKKTIDEKRVLELHNKGLSVLEISRETGHHKKSIYNLFERLSITPNINFNTHNKSAKSKLSNKNVKDIQRWIEGFEMIKRIGNESRQKFCDERIKYWQGKLCKLT
jgi:transposase